MYFCIITLFIKMQVTINKYKIFTNCNLIVELNKGLLILENYINLKLQIIKDPLFKPSMNYLICLKDADFSKVRFDDLEKLVIFKKSKASILGKRKVALITSSPSQVVSSILYKESQNDFKSTVEVFSTAEKALGWLLEKDQCKKEIYNYVEKTQE